jgi:hypothetical protein
MKKSIYIVVESAEYIGYGLFSHVAIEVVVAIGKYIGELISTAERIRKTQLGQGGYFIHLNENECVDCFKERNLKVCKLSFCNSTTTIIDRRNGNNAVQHCKLVVNTRTKIASLKVIRKIKAHEEIFTDYNTDYIYDLVLPIHLTGDSLDSMMEDASF